MKKILLFFALLTLNFSCKKDLKTNTKIHGKQIKIDVNFKKDASFIKLIEPYKQKLSSKINEVLCYNPRTLSRDESELESALGNLYADVCFQKADSIFFTKTGKTIDFALFNYNGIRTSIPKGNVRVKNLFELMPFENKLVIVQLTGKKVQNLFEYLEKRKEAHPVSQLKLSIKNDKLNTILIGEKPFDIEKKYFVLTHDYLQHGGDHMDFFINPEYLFNTQYKVRDALVDYFRSIDTVKAKLDNRFINLN